MLMPTSSATRLVVHTAGSRIIRMSISGAAARVSATTHSAAIRTAAVSRPITLAEPQPHTGAWLSATSSATSQADRSTTGAMEMRPAVRTGDSGMNSAAASPARTHKIIGSQNSQAKPR